MAGFTFGVPPEWAVRADTPGYLALWPDPTGRADADKQPDGVVVESISTFLDRGDVDWRISVPRNVLDQFHRDGLDVSDPTTGTILGGRCDVMVGSRAPKTVIVLVSSTWVVRGEIHADAVHSGETTDNVMGVLASMGYTGRAPVAR